MDNEIRWLDHNYDEFAGYIDDTFKTNDERFQIGEFCQKYGYESALKERSKGWKARKCPSELGGAFLISNVFQ